MQQGSSATTYPGGNVTFNLYFYVDEKYGDRITHIRVIASEFPDDWKVTLDPPVHPIRLNVSGVITTGEENLYVEPKPVLPQIPEKPSEGIHYLFSPSGLGYLQAKQLKINVQIPEDAERGKTYGLKIDADARWYESGGQIALVQSRTFRYDVRVISQYYTEEILPPEEPNVTLNETIIEQPKEEKAIDINLILLIIMAIIIILLLAYILLSRRKKNVPPQR